MDAGKTLDHGYGRAVGHLHRQRPAEVGQRAVHAGGALHPRGGGPGRAAGGPVPRPGDLLAAVQRAGAAAGRRPARCRCWSGPATWRSSPATSTSSSWSGSPASSAASPPASPSAPPPGSSRARSSSRSPWSARSCMAMQATVFERGRPPGAGEEGITIVRWDELRRGRAGAAARDVPRAGLPGAHPAGRRPGAPVPLHLRPLAQPRRRAGQPQDRQRALRPGQGAAAAAPLHPGRATRPPTRRWPTCTTRGSSRSRTSSPRTWTSSSPAWRSASTSPSGSPATRTSRSRRTTPRTSSPPWRRS